MGRTSTIHRGCAAAPEDGLEALFSDDELAALDERSWRRLSGPELRLFVRSLFRAVVPVERPQAAPAAPAGDVRGADSFCSCSGSSPPLGSGNTLDPRPLATADATGSTPATAKPVPFSPSEGGFADPAGLPLREGDRAANPTALGERRAA